MDLHHAACAVQGVPDPLRRGVCANLLWRAHVADKYVKRLRRYHPDWGDGSLRAVALLHEPCLPEQRTAKEYHRCLAIVLEALVRKDAAHARRNRGATGLHLPSQC